MLQASHEGTILLLLITQPDGRKMSPVIHYVFEACLVKDLFDRIMLFPRPLTRFTFDRAPGDVIFVGNQSETFEMALRLHRGRRLQEIYPWKSADRRCLRSEEHTSELQS